MYTTKIQTNKAKKEQTKTSLVNDEEEYIHVQV